MPNENIEIKQVSKKQGDNYLFRRDVASALSAGFTVACTLFPFESAKKIVQAGNRFDLSFKEICKQLLTTGKVGRPGDEYVVYRGMTAFALNVIPTTVIQFTVKKYLEDHIPDNSSSSMLAVRAIASGAIGASTATIVENMIALQQKDKADFSPTVKKMWSTSPFRMFKSYPLIAVRDSIFTLNMFFISPLVTKYAEKHFPDSVLSSKISVPLGVVDLDLSLPSMISAVIGTGLSHPFDTLATNLQGEIGKSSYRAKFNELISSGGAKELYRGVCFRFCLFYLFSMLIPKVQQNCSDFIDQKYGVNHQCFFTKPSFSDARPSNDKSNHIKPK